MIIDVHTHLSTRQQWGHTFRETIESNRGGHGTLDLHVTPERHWGAMAEASRAIVFGINSIALGMSTPNDDIAVYARMRASFATALTRGDPETAEAIIHQRMDYIESTLKVRAKTSDG